MNIGGVDIDLQALAILGFLLAPILILGALGGGR